MFSMRRDIIQAFSQHDSDICTGYIFTLLGNGRDEVWVVLGGCASCGGVGEARCWICLLLKIVALRLLTRCHKMKMQLPTHRGRRREYSERTSRLHWLTQNSSACCPSRMQTRKLFKFRFSRDDRSHLQSTANSTESCIDSGLPKPGNGQSDDMQI